MEKRVKDLGGVYGSGGSGEVKVTPNVVNKEDHLQITFQVEEGPLDVVDSFQIEGNNSLSETDMAPKGLNMTPGKAFSQQLMQKDRDQIIASYLERGYLTANFKPTARPLKTDPHKGEAVYTTYERPQAHTPLSPTLRPTHTP